MSQNISDSKLDTYVSKIKTGTNSNNKVINYKRAITRLAELKTEYNNLCRVLKQKSNSDSDDGDKKNKNVPNDKINIDNIVVELNSINNDLDKGSDNIKELIDKYIQYKLLLSELDIGTEQIKNEIIKVEENKNKITIHKLSLEDLV